MNYNAYSNAVPPVDEFLKRDNIILMYWPIRAPDPNLREDVWDIMKRKIGTRFLPPRTSQSLKTALFEERNLQIQGPTNYLIISMSSQCESYKTIRRDNSLY